MADRSDVIGKHRGLVVGLVWSPDGNRLFSGSFDGEIRSWENQTFQTLRARTMTADHRHGLAHLDWSTFKNCLVTAGNTGVGLLDSTNGSPLQPPQEIAAIQVACSPDGPFLVSSEMVPNDSGHQYRPRLRGRSLEDLSGAPLLDSDLFDGGRSYDFSWRPGGALCAVLSGADVAFWSAGRRILHERRWWVGTWANAIAWITSDDLAVAYGDANVRIFSWDANRYVDGPRAKRVLETHEAPVGAIAAGMNGALMASIDVDRNIHVYDGAYDLLLKKAVRDSEGGLFDGLRLAINPVYPVLAYSIYNRVYRCELESVPKRSSAAIFTPRTISANSISLVLDAAELATAKPISSDVAAMLWNIEPAADDPVARTKHLRAIAQCIFQLETLAANAAGALWQAPGREEKLRLEDLEIAVQKPSGERRSKAREGLQALLAEAADGPEARKRTLAICAYTALSAVAPASLSGLKAKPFYLPAVNSLDDEQLRRELKTLTLMNVNDGAQAVATALTNAVRSIEEALRRVPQDVPAQAAQTASGPERPDEAAMTSWFEDLPVDFTRGETQDVESLLRSGYPTNFDAVRLAQDAGLDPTRLNQMAPVVHLVRDMLIKARQSDRLTRLIAVVLRDPNQEAIHERLRASIAGYEGTIAAAGVRWKPSLGTLATLPSSIEVLAADGTVRPLATPGLEKIINAAAGFADPAVLRKRLAEAEVRTARIDIGGKAKGTGFLVGDRLLLTNWHVVEGGVDGAVAVFDNKISPLGKGLQDPGRAVAFAPDWLVARSVHEAPSMEIGPDGPPAGNWDFAVVRLAEPVGAQAIGPDPQANDADKRGRYLLDGNHYDFEDAEPIMILGHPAGRPVQFSYASPAGAKRTKLLNRVRYQTNTEGGSSGSPVFNRNWRVVALHHASGPTSIPGDFNLRTGDFNQGIPVSGIVGELKRQLASRPELAELGLA